MSSAHPGAHPTREPGNPLAQACRTWQSDRDGGSTPLRGAARVLTKVPHYFSADFISDQETKAVHNLQARRSAELLLAAVNESPLRTADEWNADVKLNPRGFAGRGLAPKAPYDDQILVALGTGRLAMPLLGVSLNRFAAWWFGTVGKHSRPRFMFEIVGAFRALPAWVVSGEKADEEELICGGEYGVLDIHDEQNSYGTTTTVKLSYLQPIRPVSS